VFGGSAWRWDTRRCQYYLHSFLVEQTDLNFHNTDVQLALLEEVRFWCERGVDGFRFDACNHHFHDQALRSNPPAVKQKVSTVRADNPYAMQLHWYDKSQPENLDFLESLREVLDQYGVASVGEVGDEDAAAIMADYTEEGKRLHMAYSFALTTPDHSASYIREQVRRLDRMMGLSLGWACWALSSHDVVRVASRWAPQPPILWMTLLAVLRGSICIYQGEELGLPEANVPFEKLQDPYGKTFWPEFKGRDGCRTPMPWVANAEQGGFSEGEPWLPMASSHLRLAVDAQEQQPDSMLQFCKRLLQWRRTRTEVMTGKMRWIGVTEPLLGIVREQVGKPPLLALFNLSEMPQSVSLSEAGMEAVDDSPVPSQYAGYVEDGTAFLPPYGILLSAVHV
jgi:alpha-glucosidase